MTRGSQRHFALVIASRSRLVCLMDAPLLLVAEKSRYGFNLRVGQIMRVGPLAGWAFCEWRIARQPRRRLFFRRPLYPPS